MNVFDIALTIGCSGNSRLVEYLITKFTTAEQVYNMSESELCDLGEIKTELARRILDRSNLKTAENELNFCSKHSITAVASTDPHYPVLLKECNDYPHVIYVLGNIDLLSKKLLAIVGTRKPTAYGKRMCETLVTDMKHLAGGIGIVSGLAYGVDATAHRSALACGIQTVAVMGGPLTSIYPADHRSLAKSIVDHDGAIVTEYRSGEAIRPRNFVARNRIIAGLSEGTLVVESPLKGGSLITATMADGYHRAVMAVPGRADDNNSAGTNNLIRNQTARMVCTAREVCEEMSWQAPPETVAGTIEFTEIQQRIMTVLEKQGCMSADELIMAMDLDDPSPIWTGLLDLEICGAIQSLPGRIYEKII